jgi:DNA polymerase-3 subunit chi
VTRSTTAARGEAVGEVHFYHLTLAPLEAVLPVMLERCLSRGWRAEVRGGEPERLRLLDARLWTWRDDAFLPHGLAGEPHAERQPVLLTERRGGAGAGREALFLIDGAELDPREAAGLTRTALLFDGHDPAAVAAARGQWRAAAAAGLHAIYCAQEEGGWVRKAETGSPG